MGKVTQFLLFASRSLAICAVLAGIGVGLLQATVGAAFVHYFSSGALILLGLPAG